MTREEAIQILSTRDAHGVLCGYTSGVTEALDMAIEALSADSNCNNCKEYGSYKCTRCDGEIYYKADGDLISRADAICEVLVNDGIDNIVDRISKIPSAETTGDLNDAIAKYVADGLMELPSADAVQIKQTDTLIIADALRYLAQDAERHPSDRARAEALREQILQYGASRCHAEAVQGGWIGVTNGRGGHECGARMKGGADE